MVMTIQLGTCWVALSWLLGVSSSWSLCDQFQAAPGWLLWAVARGHLVFCWGRWEREETFGMALCLGKGFDGLLPQKTAEKSQVPTMVQIQIDNWQIQKKRMSKKLFSFETQGTNYDVYRPRYPPAMLDSLLSHIPQKTRYLDVAVGTGQLLLPLAPAFQHAEAVDLSEKMVGVCRRKVQEQGLLHVDVRCEDFMTSAATNHYDLITIGEALHWFPVRQVLLKCRDWLTDHGKLAVFVYNICNKIEGADERQTQVLERLWREFFSNKMVQNFQYDVEDLNTHYTNQQKYPFREVFGKVSTVQERLPIEMDKQGFMAYIRTLSGYNTYLLKYPNECDPLTHLSVQIPETAKITLYFDFSGIICEK